MKHLVPEHVDGAAQFRLVDGPYAGEELGDEADVALERRNKIGTDRAHDPPGTRDVLPEEMRELRAIGDRVRETFEGAGYGEIHTPALEYEEVLRR